MSKKVVAIFKKRLSNQERKRFKFNCKRQKDAFWKMYLHNAKTLGTLFYMTHSFDWFNSIEGSKYWWDIQKRFTKKELNEQINLNEFKG